MENTHLLKHSHLAHGFPSLSSYKVANKNLKILGHALFWRASDTREFTGFTTLSVYVRVPVSPPCVCVTPLEERCKQRPLHKKTRQNHSKPTNPATSEANSKLAPLTGNHHLEPSKCQCVCGRFLP